MNKTALFLGMMLAGLSGCVGATEADLAGDDDVSVDEARSAVGDRLLGAWTGTTGPFVGLVFTRTEEGRGRHFFMDVDNAIRCVRAPCDSTSRVEGYFTAGALTVTLTAVPTITGPRPDYVGRFYYTLQGDTLTLSKSGRVFARLRRQASYCGTIDDCPEQNLVQRLCVGAWTCRENLCAFRCGPTRPSCASTTCRAGYICQEAETGPQCISACAAVRCAAGTQCVADASGTRCEPVGVRCGTTTCAAGLVCCNPLRNICTRPGMVCIQ